jgi:hypothetical protein
MLQTEVVIVGAGPVGGAGHWLQVETGKQRQGGQG